MAEPTSEPLSAEDLAFWYTDQPRQRTTMSMLLVLDRPPCSDGLRAAAQRAVEAVPRLRQRVVDAPFDLSRPRWEDDPTFDLDYHVRRYAVSHDDGLPGHATTEDLFRTVGPIYERPFDPSRPLWEMIELDGPGDGAAVFFRLHHAVADGVGGNAVLAALTDPRADMGPRPAPPRGAPGPWDDTPVAERLLVAARRRLEEDAAMAGALLRSAWTAVTRPASLERALRITGTVLSDAAYRSPSPLRGFGRARHLAGLELPFEPLRATRTALGGKMIDVLLTAVAGAVGVWHESKGIEGVEEVMTLVPINLRARAEQGAGAGTGNRATGVNVRLPIGERDPLRRFAEVRRRVEERKSHPAVEFFPVLAEIMAALPRRVYGGLAYAGTQAVNLIVTNVPGIMEPRYLAGSRITAGYPFAPVAPNCPVSVALYGYDGRLFVGLDADGTSMPDLEDFREMLAQSFSEVIRAGEKRAGE